MYVQLKNKINFGGKENEKIFVYGRRWKIELS